MGPYETGETIIWLPCLHRFHKNCYCLWSDEGHSTCPECRTRAGNISQLPTDVVRVGSIGIPPSLITDDPEIGKSQVYWENMAGMIEQIRRDRREREEAQSETENINQVKECVQVERKAYGIFILPIHICILFLGLLSVLMAIAGSVPGPIEPITDIGIADISAISCFKLTSHSDKKNDYSISELRKMCKGLVMPVINNANCFINSNRQCETVNHELFCELSMTKPGTINVIKQSCKAVGIGGTVEPLRAIATSKHFEKDDYLKVIYNECRKNNDRWEMCFVPDDKTACTFDSTTFCGAESTVILINGVVTIIIGLILIITGCLYPYRVRIIGTDPNTYLRYNGLWSISIKYIAFVGLILTPLILFLICWTVYEWYTFIILSENSVRYGSANNSEPLLDPNTPCGVMHTYSEILLWMQFILGLPIIVMGGLGITCIIRAALSAS